MRPYGGKLHPFCAWCVGLETALEYRRARKKRARREGRREAERQRQEVAA